LFVYHSPTDSKNRPDGQIQECVQAGRIFQCHHFICWTSIFKSNFYSYPRCLWRWL